MHFIQICLKFKIITMLRSILILALLFAIASCQVHTENSPPKLEESVSFLYDSTIQPFYHGVASGDPLHDRVIIWTRVTPKDSIEKIDVLWEVSASKEFASILKTDTYSTGPSRDYTVKVDVTGLSAGENYYYRFKAFDRYSPVGHTRTIHQRMDSLKLAVVSCSNWEFGYFNPYARIAEKDLDCVVHLGDYIYEYGPGTYSNRNVDRKHLPPYEIITLQDYRTRYSQYHLDAGLREARRQHAFITIWDDHEVANDVYSTGAGNHQAEKEGEFTTRKSAAKKAYYEWIPIREGDKHYRSFKFGSLASLIMLDERLEARVKQVDSISHPDLFNESRSMIGNEQLQWLEAQLKEANDAWKIIGNQVIFSDLDQSINPGHQRNLDSWDGYPAEKNKVADFIRQNSIDDVIFLAGDTHASWAFETSLNPSKTYNAKTSAGAIAVEFGTTSLSSGNSNENAPDDSVKLKEARLIKANPHLKFTNHRDHGYLLLTLYPQKAKAQWYYVETLLTLDNREHLAKTFEVEKGSHKLK
jgi:alkaline phosphatase D